MCILQKLQSQKGKIDWSQVTTTDLYVEKLATANSITNNFYTKKWHHQFSTKWVYEKKKCFQQECKQIYQS